MENDLLLAQLLTNKAEELFDKEDIEGCDKIINALHQLGY